MSGDVNVREFMLAPSTVSPNGKRVFVLSGDRLLSQTLVPGIYADADDAYDLDDRYSRRLVMVWGDTLIRTMVVPVRLDERQVVHPTGTRKDVNQLDRRATWLFLWPLESPDFLPGVAGGDGETVAAYIARLEAGKGETE